MAPGIRAAAASAAWRCSNSPNAVGPDPVTICPSAPCERSASSASRHLRAQRQHRRLEVVRHQVGDVPHAANGVHGPHQVTLDGPEDGVGLAAANTSAVARPRSDGTSTNAWPRGKSGSGWMRSPRPVPKPVSHRSGRTARRPRARGRSRAARSGRDRRAGRAAWRPHLTIPRPGPRRPGCAWSAAPAASRLAPPARR